MATLPKTPFTLHGSCFCKAITYTISIPALQDRPLISKNPPHPIGPQHQVNARLPIISLDHCNSCRRSSGTILQSWFICPLSWATFSLLPKEINPQEQPTATGKSDERIETDMVAYLCGEKGLRERSHLRHFSSSEGVERTFCGNCGTHLTYYFSGEEEDGDAPDWGGHFDVAVGTLERESVEMEGFRVSRQGWVGDGIPWVRKLVDEGVGGFGG